MALLDFKTFIEKYNISNDDFIKTTLKWDELENIYEDYVKLISNLEPSAIFIFNNLMKIPNVHSVRYRIKDPEHLIEKIIRRRIDTPDFAINITNYKEVVTDLIGLRALHLFKEDWIDIHKSIIDTWVLKQTPVANYRLGDSDNYFKIFKENGCETKEHKFGYRSVHYIVETQPAKLKYYAEIQVRTIFEEAWSEIDHTIRYPYDQENPVFLSFLLILNRLAGSADEMGTFIRFLQEELNLKDKIYKEALKQKEKSISELNSKIRSLQIDQAQKDILTTSINEIKWPDLDISQFQNIEIPNLDFLDLNTKTTLSDIIGAMDVSKINFQEVFKEKDKIQIPHKKKLK